MTSTQHTDFYKPTSKFEEMEIIKEQFSKKISHITMSDAEALGEYYRLMEARKIPAFEWIMEAIHVTSKKEGGKQTINYMIGIMRKWMTYGFGYIPSQEEDLIVEFIEEDYGLHLTEEARSKVVEMLGAHGVVRMTRVISKNKVDLSMAIIDLIDQALKGEDTSCVG